MRLLALLLVAAIAWSAEEPKPPEYAKELTALAAQWIEADASKDEADKAKRPTYERLQEARLAAWKGFVAHADFSPVTPAQVAALRHIGADENAIRNNGELAAVNAWMEKVQKDPDALSNGYGVGLYAAYKRAPWAYYLCQDFTPKEAKRSGDEMVKSANERPGQRQHNLPAR